jgi:hypothetical protein
VPKINELVLREENVKEGKKKPIAIQEITKSIFLPVASEVSPNRENYPDPW